MIDRTHELPLARQAILAALRPGAVQQARLDDAFRG
jgi:hypothetical protein